MIMRIKISEKQLKDIIVETIKSYSEELNFGSDDFMSENEISEYNIKMPNECDDSYVRNGINEGLIMSYPFEKVVKSLKKKFRFNDEQVIHRTIENNGEFVTLISIILPFNSTKTELGNIDNFMNTCGFFKTQVFKRIGESANGILIYEPKYSHDISNKIREECSVIYHSAPNICLNKILKRGLVPSNKNALFYYPDRAYCMIGDYMTKEQLLTLKNVQMVRNHQRPQDRNPYDDLKYSLLTIDVDKIPMDVKMYIDPMAPNAFFTYDVIPPNAIISVSPFTLNNNI